MSAKMKNGMTPSQAHENWAGMSRAASVGGASTCVP